MLYHAISFNCFNNIKKYVSSYMKEFNSDRIYIKNIPFPDELTNEINLELEHYGFGRAWNFLCFKRKNFLKIDDNVHIDSFDQEPIDCSIIFPIENCSSTFMYWLGGNYIIKQSSLEGTNISYIVPEWIGKSEVIDKIEINQSPVLAKVSIPHGVTSQLAGSYRTVLSVRIIGNPQFEDLIKKLINVAPASLGSNSKG